MNRRNSHFGPGKRTLAVMFAVFLMVTMVLPAGIMSSGVNENVSDALRPSPVPMSGGAGDDAIQTITLQPNAADGKDTYISNASGNDYNNYGGNTGIWVGNDTATTYHRILIYFNLPTTAVNLNSATLDLYEYWIGSPVNVTVYPLTSAWAENEVNWVNSSAGVPWNIAGGDYDNTLQSYLNVSVSDTRNSWNITSIVKAWISGSLANNGLVLIGTPYPASKTNYLRIWSSDYTGDTNLTPKLTLSYHAEIDPPVPAQTLNEDDPIRNIDLSGRGHGSIVQVSGPSTNPGNDIPFFGAIYDQCRFQALYYPEEVGAEGVIRRISFNRSASQVGVYNNSKISMAHTDLALLTNTFANNYKGYLVEVFPIANVEINSSNGDSWIHFDLNDNFTYDSSHNLLIDIEWNGDNGISVGIDQTNPGTPDRRKYSLDGGGVGSAGDRLPVIKFVTDVVDNGVVDGGKGTINRTIAPDDVSEMRCQMLYNHTLINETGIIDKIRFQPNQATPDWVVLENLSIRMAHSQNDTLGTVFEAHRNDAWTQVFNRVSYNFSTSSGPEWIEIDVDNLFQYNGNDNLLIDLRWKGGYGGSNWGVNLSAECVAYQCRLMVDNYSATNGTPDFMLYNLQAIFLESASLTWSASSSDMNLFTAGVSGRTLQITPVADAFGDGTVTLTLHNSNGETVSQHIPVTINPVNDAPVFSGAPTTIQCTEDVDFVLNMTSYASDIDNNAINLTFSTDSVYAFTAGEPEITFNYPEGILNDFVNITVRDPGGLTDAVMISVTITPVNDAPQLTGFVSTFSCEATIAKTYTVHPVDEETVTGQLMIYTSSTYANVTNHAISFLYPKGIGSESVTIYLVDENIYGSRNNISYVLAVTINDHPEVTAHSPSGTGVVVTTTIEVTFDMAMNDSVTENAFSLTYGTTDINGTFSWNAGHTTMTFTPAAHLTNGVYDVSVGIGARSETGIAPFESYSWNFTAALGNYDGDGDGMPDQYEIDNGLDPDTDDSTMDKDGDGMPNLWEYQNDLDPSVNDAGLDPDGDGFSNLDEYQAGTDPNDLNDKPYSFPMLLILLIIIIVIVVLLAAILLMRRGNRARGREAEQFDEDPYSGAEAGESMQEPGTPPGELEVGEPLEHQEGSPPPPPPTE